MIEREGSIPLVLEAMKNHADNVPLLDTAIAALWNLGTKGSKPSFVCFCFRSRLCFICVFVL